jgi:hypothetical protein
MDSEMPAPLTVDGQPRAIAFHPDTYEGRFCSICDGLGHGYPGGPPCPLEIADYSDEPWWAH